MQWYTAMEIYNMVLCTKYLKHKLLDLQKKGSHPNVDFVYIYIYKTVTDITSHVSMT